MTRAFAWFVFVDSGAFLGKQPAGYWGNVEDVRYYLSLGWTVHP